MRRLLLSGLLFWSLAITSQIYVVNNENQLKIIDESDFTVTDLFTIDLQEFGYITDLAFAPDGRLFGVTGNRTIIEINLLGESATVIANLPTDAVYTSLVCNANFELLTAKFLNLELYKYDLDTGDFTFVDEGISSPGDFTFYKGNLIYPNIFNDFIKAYDGTMLYDVGCSVPLLYAFVNVFADCENNTVYGIDEDSKIYLYDLEADTREEVADLLDVTGPIFGGATMTEYMASQCPLEILDETNCNLSTGDETLQQPFLAQNPTNEVIQVRNLPEGTFRYSLYDTMGRIILEGPYSSEGINAAFLSTGMYYLQLRDGRDSMVFKAKIIKQ